MIDIILIALFIASLFCRYKLISIILIASFLLWKFVEYKENKIRLSVVAAVILLLVLGYFQLFETIGCVIIVLITVAISIRCTISTNDSRVCMDNFTRNGKTEDSDPNISDTESWLKMDIFSNIQGH